MILTIFIILIIVLMIPTEDISKSITKAKKAAAEKLNKAAEHLK